MQFFRQFFLLWQCLILIRFKRQKLAHYSQTISILNGYGEAVVQNLVRFVRMRIVI
jgi:hypothetical protein